MSRISGRAAALAVIGLLAGTAQPAAAQDVSDIDQIGSLTGGVATVTQQGNRNDAGIAQRAVASGALEGQNHALITQNGDDNTAIISQEGSANKAEIAQNGNNNEGVIIQHNSGNDFNLQQSGNGLSFKIEQFGAAAPGSAPISVTQSN